MLYFVNDYSEGATPEILDKLRESNLTKQAGYGSDEFCILQRKNKRSYKD